MSISLNISYLNIRYSEIYPYIVIIIGLENILIITKSVVSTPIDLEVRERIAEGKNSSCENIYFRYLHKS